LVGQFAAKLLVVMHEAFSVLLGGESGEEIAVAQVFEREEWLLSDDRGEDWLVEELEDNGLAGRLGDAAPEDVE